jgi:NAD-dependent SIR2 family protein deacetylase
MVVTPETWCERDVHKHFECFIDFNEWLDDADDSETIRKTYGLNNVSWPSKALFAGDKEAYDQVFKAYRDQKRREVLSAEYIQNTFGDDHWFERNEQRFDQLVALMKDESVVPFIGAGVSVAGGFPTWKDHLRKQGKTAGIAAAVIEAHLAKGEFETIIETIEASRGPDVFAQEIRDAFSKTGKLEAITLRITELFRDTLITTNYDHLLEQAFDTGPNDEVQVISSTGAMDPRDPAKIAIIKLHGDVQIPARCILGKKQYDAAYGETVLDLTRPIPKLLQYHYTTSNLLFIGCSLNNDRTIQVFKAAKEEQRAKGVIDLPQHFSIEQAPENVAELATRNAELLKLGITPIWFPTGEYGKVENILRHAYNEQKYQAE